MKTNVKEKNTQEYILLRRMRESAELTMRQVGAIVGISHVAISQFENGKLELPRYRIEQLVKAYGLDMASFNKILGRSPVVSPKDDCHAMINRMDEEQLTVIHSVMVQFFRKAMSQTVTDSKTKTSPTEQLTQ